MNDLNTTSPAAWWGNTIFWHDGPVCAWMRDANDRDLSYLAMALPTECASNFIAVAMTPASRLRFMRGEVCVRTLMCEPEVENFLVHAPTQVGGNLYMLTLITTPLEEGWLPSKDLTWAGMSAIDEGRLRK